MGNLRQICTSPGSSSRVLQKLVATFSTISEGRKKKKKELAMVDANCNHANAAKI
jgi:hypothetical protein